jgi:hypothetical protein
MEVLDVVTRSPLQGGQKWFDSDERTINIASEDGVLSPGEEFVPKSATSFSSDILGTLPIFSIRSAPGRKLSISPLHLNPQIKAP